MLISRFDVRTDAADLEAAIETGQRATEMVPHEDPHLAACLSTLGTSLLSRFRESKAASDLDAAVEVGQRAVEVAGPGHPHLHDSLSILGMSLLTRYEQAADAADLDAAIAAGRQAVDLTPPGHANLAGHLSNLGGSLATRFALAREATDLAAAIEVGRRAVEVAPPGHPRLPMYLSNLSTSMTYRFEQTGGIADLHAAIEAGQRAVDLTPPGHRDRPRYERSLGTLLRLRFDRSGSSAALGHSAGAWRRSRRETEPRFRFVKAEDAAALEDVIVEASQRAVALTPPGHPHLAGYLANLADLLNLRFEIAGDAADLDNAIEAWQQASQLAAASARIRLGAAKDWADAAAGAGRIHEAAEGYAIAVEMLSQVTWHGLGSLTRAEQLAQWADLVGDAAACTILDGRPGSAVELLEQSRSVLWNQALNLRGDLSRLASVAPELAERLSTIRNDLDSPISVPQLERPLPGHEGNY